MGLVGIFGITPFQIINISFISGTLANSRFRSIYKRSIGPLDGDYFPSGDNNYAAKRQAGYNAWRKGKRSHSGYDSLAQ